MFKDLSQRKSTVDLCEDELKKSILSGRFRVGDPLPPEREMADMFGINRMTLRTALARVAALGILSVRQGSGYRVEDYRLAGGPQLIGDLLSLTGQDSERLNYIDDLLRIRRHLARALLEKISQNPQLDTEPVNDAIEDFAHVVERGGSVAELARADFDVMSALIHLTKSPIYGLCISPIQRLLTQVSPLTKAMYTHPEANLSGYRVLQFVLKNPQEGIVDPLLQEITRRDEAVLRRLSQIQDDE